ncbi:MAG: hypothetical protein ACKOB2_06920 [Solirubrobacterales bacterium]
MDSGQVAAAMIDADVVVAPTVQSLSHTDARKRASESGTTIAELGIGTNARATLTGNVLEDEKILGTAHDAFGASAAIGGSVQVPVHLDVVSLRPEVTVDDLPITLEGRLLVGS